MSAEIEQNTGLNAAHHRPLLRHLPAMLAVVAIGLIYTAVSAQLSLGPRGLILGLVLALLVPLVLAVRYGRLRMTRTLAFSILGVITGAEAVSTVYLVVTLLGGGVRINEVPHDTALVLLRDAALIWLVNILTFALWYWEIDAGGPGRRHNQGYRSADFVFPQVTLDGSAAERWCPRFVDYLFLAFNTSTAFSPTDTLVLSVRAKLLMMTQALISLTVLAIIAARAINTL